MRFGVDKCTTSTMEKGKWVSHDGYGIEQKIEVIEREEACKYLGYLQAKGIEIQIVNKQIRQNVRKRTTIISKRNNQN